MIRRLFKSLSGEEGVFGAHFFLLKPEVNETSSRRSNDEIIRSMIEKENDYIHSRVTWFCTLQGLLLAALSFVASQQNAGCFFVVVCILGIAVAIIIWHPIYYAHRAAMTLLDWWDEHKPEGYDGPDVIGGRPPFPLARYIAPWHVLPVIFLAAWGFILWCRFCSTCPF